MTIARADYVNNMYDTQKERNEKVNKVNKNNCDCKYRQHMSVCVHFGNHCVMTNGGGGGRVKRNVFVRVCIYDEKIKLQ